MKQRFSIFYFFLGMMLLLMGSGCAKNEFIVEGEITGVGTQNFHIFYYASDNKKGWMAENIVPCVDGIFSQMCITRRPTFVHILSSSGMVMTSFYARRGDKIHITGDIKKPLQWEIDGNPINRNLTEWRKDNEKLLEAGFSISLNNAATEYAAANPDNPVSAIILILYYSRNLNPDGFEKAWNSLSDKARDKDVLNAVTGANTLLDYIPDISPVTSVTLFDARTDSMETIDFRPYAATILYFWRSTDDLATRYRNISSLSKSIDKNTEVLFADVSFDADTVLLRRTMRGDSLSDDVPRLWAPGGEMNSELTPFGLRGTPCIVVINSAGKTVYRGKESATATALATELSHKKN